MSYGDNGNGTALAPRTEMIESRIDKMATGAIEISNEVGGVYFKTMADLMEFAKLMAISGICIPKHLRGQPGACLAICMQAVEWRMSPYAVANKSYTVNDRISYESQLIHAVVEQRAPLVGRLRATYDGEGQNRTCTVIGFVKGEAEPLKFTSSPFSKIQPKNSPLWQTKPDLQLFYNASRDWARMYFPDLILGVYSSDEIEPARLPEHDGKSRTAALAERFAQPAVVQHPTDETRTVDRSTNNLTPEDAEKIINEAPRAATEEVDVSGADTEPAAPDITTFDTFVDSMRALARAISLDNKDFDAAIRQVVVDHPVKKTQAARKLVYEAAEHGAFDWSTGKVVG